MISTDACGRGSCPYRKTSNHVLALRVALTDGTDFLSRQVDGAELCDRMGSIHRALARIASEDRANIKRIYSRSSTAS